MDTLATRLPSAGKDPTSVYLAPISWGLGDLIFSLPIAQGLIDDGWATYLVIRSRLHEALAQRMAGLRGAVLEESFLSHPDRRTRIYLNPREHPLQKDWWWGSPEYYARFGDRRINDLLAEICRDLGIRVNFDRLVPLQSRNRAGLEDTVILIPGSDGVFKCWPSDHWLALARELSARGRRVLMLGQPERSEAVHALAGSIALESGGLTACLDAISSASAVIGVDTGLTHLAVHQGIPTICLYRSRPVYWRPYPHCFKVEARDPCADACYQAELSCRSNDVTSFVGFQPRSWRCGRAPAESCMATIRPFQVLDIIDNQTLLAARGS
ncbi:MAG: glycosyltransferase family 9 protein [Bryobacteraceae bacterium]